MTKKDVRLLAEGLLFLILKEKSLWPREDKGFLEETVQDRARYKRLAMKGA